MTGSDESRTLDPAVDGRASSVAFERHSTLVVRRLVIADRRVVVKVATGRNRAPLRAEANLLRLIGPALAPEVVAIRERDDRTDLVLDDIGRTTIADLADLDVSERLRVLERCAVAVDTLHRAGWTHGALCAEHVVLDDELGVRLVSLGSARPLSDGSEARTDDLRQLLGLVGVVARTPLSGGARRRRWRRVQRTLHRLESVDPSALGSGDRLAAEIGSISRPDETGSRVRAANGPVRPREPVAPHRIGSALTSVTLAPRSARRRVLARRALRRGDASDERRWIALRDLLPRRLAPLAATVALIVLAALVVTRAMGAAPSSGEAPANPVEPLTGACPHVATSPASDVAPTRPVDLSGDGCADQVRIIGTTVEINGVSYRVGAEGDEVILADEDCDGVASVHLHRPSTGERFVFDELPERGTILHARTNEARPGARGHAGVIERCADHLSLPSPDSRSTGDPP